ncbi:MAG: TldD/PmbA family protein [Fervidicoccaceae archaeon]
MQLEIEESLFSRLIDEGLKEGAKYIEIRFQSDKGSNLSMRNGKVLGFSSYGGGGVGIRVLLDGGMGFASTNILDPSSMKEALSRALSAARSAGRLRKRKIELSEERLGRASYEAFQKRKIDDLGAEELIEMGKGIEQKIRDSLRSVKLPVFVASFSSHLQEKLIVTSDGAQITSRIPRLYAYLNFVIEDGGRTMQRWREFGGSGGAELLDEWKLAEEAGEEAANLEKVLTKGVRPPSEKIELILGQEIVGLAMHESSGHPMEADRILGREAAQAGESFVKPEKFGTKIGSELATVIEDPTVPGSMGFYLFDDEGVPARPRYLYKEGLIWEPLLNRETAYMLNTKSNGAARAMNYASEPIVRMSNTYMEPGDMSFDELIEDIEFGVYIKSYMEWNIDDVRWNQRYVGLESYIIRKGEIAEPILNPVVEITTGEFYGKLTAKDKNLKFFPGTCGKGEPHQEVPVWFGGPNIRLSSVKIRGLGD